MQTSREIEAAKLRLTAAKPQLSLAAQLMESATKEVEEAEAFLLETEKRWEVIDIDFLGSNGLPAEKKKGVFPSSQNKRRRISASPMNNEKRDAEPSATSHQSQRQTFAVGHSPHNFLNGSSHVQTVSKMARPEPLKRTASSTWTAAAPLKNVSSSEVRKAGTETTKNTTAVVQTDDQRIKHIQSLQSRWDEQLRRVVAKADQGHSSLLNA